MKFEKLKFFEYGGGEWAATKPDEIFAFSFMSLETERGK